MSGNLDSEQQVQEDQYEFPYHYIPSFEDGFSQARHWWWGFRYLGGIKVLFDMLSDMEFERLIDVGCGDGRVLRELSEEYPSVDMIGVDYSERAIELANALNPDLDFRTTDIRTVDFESRFDIATAVEVLEHIPPDDLDSFVASISDTLVKDGSFIATVPHSNTSVNPKHYQHFSETKLRDTLSPHFENVETIPIDARRKSLSLLQKLIGGHGNYFLITNPYLLSLFFNVYKKFYLYTSEQYCGRLAAICHKQSA